MSTVTYVTVSGNELSIPLAVFDQLRTTYRNTHYQNEAFIIKPRALVRAMEFAEMISISGMADGSLTLDLRLALYVGIDEHHELSDKIRCTMGLNGIVTRINIIPS